MRPFEAQLLDFISKEASKLAERYQRYHNNLQLEYRRACKRVKAPPPKQVRVPEYWAVDPKFNPFYVLHKRRQIARSISQKISSGTYQPNPPHIKPVPKHGGKLRYISVYQIPDAAVSTLYYRQLLAKNRHRFSSFSYAYRNDRNVHFAIQDIAIDIEIQPRTFLAEFDFSDFFGSISHKYLFEQYDRNGFSVSLEERDIIAKFLANEKKQGIPQGTSLSLFLANLVCWELDKELERNGIRFARYADDTVVWSNSYQQVCTAFDIIHNFSSRVGARINAEKSDGISLLVRDNFTAELARAKKSFEFLGYAISPDRVSIRAAKIKKIKKQISYILYKNLIQPLQGAQLQAFQIPSNNKDHDFLVALSQIRRYLYGNLSERFLRAYIKGRSRHLHFKGLMSFYPLVNDEKQLKEIDGWLLSTIYRTIQLRSRLLMQWGFDRRHSFPFNLERAQLVEECQRQSLGQRIPLEIPSFLRIYKAIQQGIANTGLTSIINPRSNHYHY